jgi:hypothetical protein
MLAPTMGESARSFSKDDFEVLCNVQFVPFSVKTDISEISNANQILSRVSCLVKFEIDDAINRCLVVCTPKCYEFRS